jgi:hypothetical protein
MTLPRVRARAARGEIVSYGDGRVCAKPECDTLLSRYNSTTHCAEHDRYVERPKSWNS